VVARAFLQWHLHDGDEGSCSAHWVFHGSALRHHIKIV
jgi:hypothetical protein